MPVKPEPEPGTEPALEALLAKSKDGVQNFYTDRIMPFNPANNSEILALLREFFDKWGIGPNNRLYKVLTVDSDIFYKIVRVGIKPHSVFAPSVSV